jgi:hypothetical protein
MASTAALRRRSRGGAAVAIAVGALLALAPLASAGPTHAAGSTGALAGQAPFSFD